MKKLFFILILFFNLTPSIKNGEISIDIATAANAQSMGEEEVDVREPNGYHLVLWENGQYTGYWEDVAEGNQGGGNSGQGGGQVEEPPYEIYYNDEFGDYTELEDPDDGYFHLYHNNDEYLYEWDEYDRRWQIQFNFNSSNSNPKRYYVTLNSENHRYYDGDKIYVKKANGAATLTLNKEGNGQWFSNNFSWVRNGGADTAKCGAVVSCNTFNLNQSGASVVRVDSSGIKTIIRNPLIISEKPIVIFERGPNYNGTYGFDDSCHKHTNITAITKYKLGLETKTISSDNSYVVPWLSLLPQRVASINIKKINLDTSYANDPNFWVDFISTSSNVSIQGVSSHMNYAQLLALSTVNITATEWDSSLNSIKGVGTSPNLIKSIFVITNSNDTIGKLNITCLHPEVKKVAIIYVQTDANGYNTNSSLTRAKIVNYLSNNSHNQFFRTWTLNTTYSDTLDLTSEFSANPTWFHTNVAYSNITKALMKTHRGLDIDSLNSFYPANSSNKIHFMFIFNFDLMVFNSVLPNGDSVFARVRGTTELGGSVGSLFSTTDYYVVSHEWGHILDLHHTMESPYNLPENVTTNFMDYIPQSSIKKANMFFYPQWIDVY